MAARNLLSRLNARGEADLGRIATEWRLGPASRDRAGLVTAVYRTLTDPVAVREWLAEADPDLAALASYLVDQREAVMTVPEIADALSWELERTREAANALHRVGLIARDPEAESLPVGEMPRVVMSREISSVLQRVLTEIALGDRSQVPLVVLLEWLEDGELEDAAREWGLTVVAGATPRKELVARVMKQVTDAHAVGIMTEGLGNEAGTIYQAIAAAGGRALLDDAVERARLLGDDPSTVSHRRATLARLEQQLLVWPSWAQDGARLLFIPGEILSPPVQKPGARVELPEAPLNAVAAPVRPEHAVAWDLLTLLRDIHSHVWTEGHEPTRAHRRRLLEAWWPSDEERFAGYLAFLLHVAKAEGLIETAAGEGRRLVLQPTVRQWRDRSFPDQTRRLRWWLRDAEKWVEGQAQGDVEVWGADWPGFRRRLVALLAEGAGRSGTPPWVTVDALAARLAEANPELLGPRFSAATARIGGEAPSGGDTSAARIAALTEVVRVELETAMTWFGAIAHGMAAEVGEVVRIVPGRVAALGDAAQADDGTEHQGPALSIEADGRIVLRQPSPVRVWSLGAFADLEQLDDPAVYRLTEKSISRALHAGFDVDQVTTFLERQNQRPLPQQLRAQVTAWTRTMRRVKAQDALVIVPDNPQDRAAIVDEMARVGVDCTPLREDALVIALDGTDATKESVLKRLKEAGMTVYLAGS